MGKGDWRRPTDTKHVQDCTIVGHMAPNARGECGRCGWKYGDASRSASALDDVQRPETD